jgi:hypothetical protein
MHFYSYAIYGLLIMIYIIVPCMLIARQEADIEGFFGWSALSFTKRYSTNHLLSKVYRATSGQDKWADSYHFVANSIWLLLFSAGAVIFPVCSMVGNVSSKFIWAFLIISANSFIMLLALEDYLWFIVNPYYGRKRYNKSYVPWIQKYAGHVESTYLASFALTFVIALAGSWLITDLKLFWLWTSGFVSTIIIAFIVIPFSYRKRQRLPLEKEWWQKIDSVIIRRNPYAIESEEPHERLVGYSISDDNFEKYLTPLIAKGIFKQIPT